MHQKWQKKVCAGALCVAVLCSGCGSKGTIQTDTTEVGAVSQEIKLPVLESEITYEIPVSTVNVLADRNGYQMSRDKEVFFSGNDLGEEFQVIDTVTGQIVFTGKIEKRDDGISQGDFSELKETGTFYIETEKIGRSYPFEIADDIDYRLLQGLLSGSNAMTYDKTAQDVYELSMGIHSFLVALQFHGSIFEKDSDLVTWILKAASIIMESQDEKGSVYEDYKATAAFCGVMNLCAKNFGKYDSELAASYKTASQKAWNWLKTQENTDADAFFYAAAASFNTEADENAKNEVVSYFEGNKGHLTGSYFSIFGSMLYLSAEQGTDRDLCHVVMQELVEQTEVICEKEKENPYLVYTEEMAEDMKQLFLISFIDYVSPSNEYAVVMENAIHYLSGRNAEGLKLIDMSGEWMQDTTYTEEWEPVWNGVLINCLSGLIDDEE